jgi:ABC-type phosphate transport system substrate-binding protein
MRFASIRLGLAAAVMCLYAHEASSEVVVIVSNKNPLTALSVEQVSDIFLGKTGNFPDGTTAAPVDVAETSPVRQEFYIKAAGKTSQLLKAYWSKMIFTGRGEPPRELADSAAVKRMVAENPRCIGYIDKSAADSSVKVVLTVK